MSSRKQHPAFCQLRINTTAFPVDRGEIPKQQRRQRHHSNNKARLPHRLYFSIESSRGKEPPADAIPGRMHATGFFRGCRALLTTTFAWRSLTTGTFFPLVFYVEHVFPVFWYTLPTHAISQTKSLCEIEHQSVCVLLLVPKLLSRVQTMSMCPNYHPRGRGRGHSYFCCVALSGAAIVSTPSPRFSHACACHVYPCTYVPTEIQ